MAVTVKSNRDVILAQGREMFMRIALELKAGQHLLSCAIEMAPGVTIPARVLVDVSDDEIGLIYTDHSQVTTFATVLGAGLLNASIEFCQVTARSLSTTGITIEQVWEKDMGTGLSALTASEAHARRASEVDDEVTFRDAVPLDMPSGILV
ncbi:hypothetical protein [Streptomyces clavifer]|uniref:hypothetical protein n=1 Tax=Streptomyces clavifer TaxID=68188 RepID=UPI00365C2806